MMSKRKKKEVIVTTFLRQMVVHFLYKFNKFIPKKKIKKLDFIHSSVNRRGEKSTP